MILGECPHCDKPIANAISSYAPCFSKEVCEHCNKEYWLKHSRIDPTAYAEKPKEVGKKINLKS